MVKQPMMVWAEHDDIDGCGSSAVSLRYQVRPLDIPVVSTQLARLRSIHEVLVVLFLWVSRRLARASTGAHAGVVAFDAAKSPACVSNFPTSFARHRRPAFSAYGVGIVYCTAFVKAVGPTKSLFWRGGEGLGALRARLLHWHAIGCFFSVKTIALMTAVWSYCASSCGSNGSPASHAVSFSSKSLSFLSPSAVMIVDEVSSARAQHFATPATAKPFIVAHPFFIPLASFGGQV